MIGKVALVIAVVSAVANVAFIIWPRENADRYVANVIVGVASLVTLVSWLVVLFTR